MTREILYERALTGTRTGTMSPAGQTSDIFIFLYPVCTRRILHQVRSVSQVIDENKLLKPDW